MLIFYYCMLQMTMCSFNNSQWIAPTAPLMPSPDLCMAIGQYENHMYIIGGYYNPQQLVTYDISSNNFTDNGTHKSPVDVYGWGQFYTQQNNILYMSSYNRIVTFNLITKTFEANWKNITVPNMDTGYHSCLSVYNNYLFVIEASLQIFNMSSVQWVSNAPSMHIPRYDSACVIQSKYNRLYAIGGGDGGYNINPTIELLDVSDMAKISTKKWQYNKHSLVQPTTYTRAVIFEQYTFVFGWSVHSVGYQSVPKNAPLVQLINCETGEVTLHGKFLSFGTFAPAAINVNNIIYLFGGSNDFIYGCTNKWQYTNLNPTNSPTKSPTKSTKSPSLSPTHPTIEPTNEPTPNKTESDHLLTTEIIVIVTSITAIACIVLLCFRCKHRICKNPIENYNINLVNINRGTDTHNSRIYGSIIATKGNVKRNDNSQNRMTICAAQH